MILTAYRFKRSITAVVGSARGYKLRELPEGSLFSPVGAQTDPDGMIGGTCKGVVALVFVRDLEQGAEPLAAEVNAA
jgi:hypothetical protein